MKRFRKVMLLVLLLVCSFAFVSNTYVTNAATYKTDDGNYNYTTTKETRREIAQGAEIIVNEGYTTRSKIKYDQRVTAYTCDVSSNSDIKLATWAIPNGEGTGFIRRDLLTIAQDYEKNNPGWVVLGGINADQYFATLGTSVQTNGSYLYVPQPYYPMITNGDVLFGVSAYGYATYSSVVGLKNDGSAKPFVNGTRGNDGFYVHIYDENMNEIAAYPLDGINTTVGSKGAVVLASYRSNETTYATIKSSGTNDVYIVGSPDQSYVSNSRSWTGICQYATDHFFGKGTITEITKSATFNSAQGFGIETNNDELKAKLSVGTYVKVEMKFDSAFDGIQEAIGYHTVQRTNGKDNNVANSYNTRAYPRSWFGFDANGKAYLMTCFGDNSSPTTGLYAQEMNAFCKAYGITDAWQMDGGGSVTSVVRKENGILGYAEACVEATHNNGGELAYEEYRYVLSGLFVVMKAPQAEVEVSEVTDTTAKLSVNVTNLRQNYDSAKIRVQSVDTTVYQIFDLDFSKDINEIYVTGLASKNDYTYEFVTTKGDYEQDGFKRIGFNSKGETPKILKTQAVKTASGYDITLKYTDVDKTMYNLYVNIGGNQYECIIDEENGLATVSIPGNVSLWDLEIEAKCILDMKTRRKTMEVLQCKKYAFPVDYCFDSTFVSIADLLTKFCD